MTASDALPEQPERGPSIAERKAAWLNATKLDDYGEIIRPLPPVLTLGEVYAKIAVFMANLEPASDAEWEQLEAERERRRIAELTAAAGFPRLQARITMATYLDDPRADRAAHEAATRWLEEVTCV